jgi:hypothetical protein
MRILPLTIAGVAMGAALLMSATAYAGSPAATVKPTSAYQGGSYYVGWTCPSGSNGYLVSPLLSKPVKLAAATGYVKVKVSPNQSAGKFPMTVFCKPGQWATGWVTIYPWWPSKGPAPQASPSVIGGKTPAVTVETGFGGMAALVARHHPVG